MMTEYKNTCDDDPAMRKGLQILPASVKILISLSLMSLIKDTSALMMSICLLNFLRVVINCSGSLWIPTQHPLKDLEQTHKKIKMFDRFLFLPLWSLRCWNKQFSTGFPCSIPLRTPGWVRDCFQHSCKPSGRDSSQGPQLRPPVFLEQCQDYHLHHHHGWGKLFLTLDVLWSCLGLASLPSLPMGELILLKWESVEA